MQGLGGQDRTTSSFNFSIETKEIKYSESEIRTMLALLPKCQVVVSKYIKYVLLSGFRNRIEQRYLRDAATKQQRRAGSLNKPKIHDLILVKNGRNLFDNHAT